MSSRLQTARFNPRSWLVTPAKNFLPTSSSLLSKDFERRAPRPYAFERPIFSDHTTFVLPDFDSHWILDHDSKLVVPTSIYPSSLALWLPESLTSREYTFHEAWYLHDSVLVIVREMTPLTTLLSEGKLDDFAAHLASVIEDLRPFLVRFPVHIFFNSNFISLRSISPTTGCPFATVPLLLGYSWSQFKAIVSNTFLPIYCLL